jgi:hypothetical protein
VSLERRQDRLGEAAAGCEGRGGVHGKKVPQSGVRRIGLRAYLRVKLALLAANG